MHYFFKRYIFKFCVGTKWVEPALVVVCIYNIHIYLSNDAASVYGCCWIFSVFLNSGLCVYYYRSLTLQRSRKSIFNNRSKDLKHKRCMIVASVFFLGLTARDANWVLSGVSVRLESAVVCLCGIFRFVHFINNCGRAAEKWKQFLNTQTKFMRLWMIRINKSQNNLYGLTICCCIYTFLTILKVFVDLLIILIKVDHILI